MDALEIIQQNLTVELVKDLLIQLGFQSISTSGDYIRAKCNVHGGNNPSAFVFSAKKGMWFCHSCGAFGDATQLVETINKVEFVEAVEYMFAFLGISLDGVTIKRRSTKLENDLKNWFDYCNKKVRKVDVYDMPNVELKNIIQFRSFSENTLRHFGLQFAENFPLVTKEDKTIDVHRKLVMPILFNKNIVGVALRRTLATEKIKWLFQPTNLDKRNLLYNLEDKWYDEIVLVEGIFDVWAYHEIGVYNVVALLGLNITDEQMKLLEMRTLNIILSLDGDTEGQKGTMKNINLLKKKFSVKVVDFNITQDPENIDRHTLQNLYESKIHYKKWEDLHK